MGGSSFWLLPGRLSRGCTTQEELQVWGMDSPAQDHSDIVCLHFTVKPY